MSIFVAAQSKPANMMHTAHQSVATAFVLLSGLLVTPSTLFTLVSANDDCADAVAISTGSLPTTISGQFESATPDFPTPSNTVNNATCGIHRDRPGVWYAIEGNDDFLRALVEETTAGVDGVVNVNTALFERSDGSSACSNPSSDLECIRFSEYSLEQAQANLTSTWYAQKDVVYYLHVAAKANVANASFDVTFESAGIQRPANDVCSAATQSELPISVAGQSNAMSIPANMQNDECFIRPSSRGLFYKFAGGGNELEITLSNIVPHNNGGEVEMEVALLKDDSDGDGQCGSTCVIAWDFLEHTTDKHELVVPKDLNETDSYILFVSGSAFNDIASFDLEVNEASATKKLVFGFIASIVCAASTIGLAW
uniref:Uncharacterized protein n=2 Tax=Craspedostauros australis TaxID=1486917 RepID=A0A7R9WUN2_9STRA|mmetsp:Transcript_18741/g.52122  ORF Transcript_18741/g.52122 Transcript_18741/m.52122 type:complete len:369 (+) Transcript_18741:76-1182(+)